MKPDALAHMMARLERNDEQARQAPQPVRAEAEPRDMRLPVPLARRLNVSHLDEIRWRWLAPGVHTHILDTPETAGTLRLLRIGPGVAMPEHGHGGTELTLVLSGSYADETGRYGAGDIADLDEDAEHSPKVDSDDDCICLIATEAPTRFKGVFGRLVQRYVGF
ncbi:ChrR family anti-sigma-E factor [Lutibaculum baratangense]|uniref:Putative transcriptional activator n=1 Tax=Lutibaculum baratangense AMV1 TaxID=631454 RepID=V4R168_9HYPH|nr:ChrR family anti-sigma-E factor [Lutibaculum baratangense]ESR25737.1 putative transcriptional activator [Lutibaculum baratangense AMV1]